MPMQSYQGAETLFFNEMISGAKKVSNFNVISRTRKKAILLPIMNHGYTKSRRWEFFFYGLIIGIAFASIVFLIMIG